MDSSADRRIGGDCQILCWRRRAAGAHCARSEAWPGCTRNGGTIRWRRHRWPLPQSVDTPTIAQVPADRIGDAGDARVSSIRRVAHDHMTPQQTPFFVAEVGAGVQRATVVPQNKIADAPFVRVDELILLHM